MTLHDKLATVLRAQNDEEVGTHHEPVWCAVVEGDVVDIANEIGVDFLPDELDQVFGAAACIVVRHGDEVQSELFASASDAGARWDEIASQV